MAVLLSNIGLPKKISSLHMGISSVEHRVARVSLEKIPRSGFLSDIALPGGPVVIPGLFFIGHRVGS